MDQPTLESFKTEIRNIQAHAALTQFWAGELLKKIDAGKLKGKEDKRTNGLG